MPSVLMPIEYKGGEEAGAIICLSKPQCFSDIYMFLGSLYVPRICLSFGGWPEELTMKSTESTLGNIGAEKYLAKNAWSWSNYFPDGLYHCLTSSTLISIQNLAHSRSFWVRICLPSLVLRKWNGFCPSWGAFSNKWLKVMSGCKLHWVRGKNHWIVLINQWRWIMSFS